MSDSKVVRNFLRCLPKRFQPKVTFIDKSKKNIDTLKLDELVGNLQNYEADHHKRKKSKGFALNIKIVTIEVDTDYVKRYKKHLLKKIFVSD